MQVSSNDASVVGAVGRTLNEDFKTILYKVGRYDSVDWNSEHPCALGCFYSSFFFKNDVKDESQYRALELVQNVSGEYSLRIKENQRYIFKIVCINKEKTEEFSSDVIHNLIPRFPNELNKFLKVERDSDNVTFQFVNYLGRSKAIFAVNGQELVINFEVVPEKINYESDYIALTESLAEHCSALLLDYAGPTTNLYSIGNENNRTLLEQFIFLRQFCYSENIQGLFSYIKRNPDRVLVNREEFSPLGVGVPSFNLYKNPFKYGKNWGLYLSGTSYYLPQEVAIVHKSDSLDTPANRFIKLALSFFNEICIKLCEQLKGEDNSSQYECVKEAEGLHSILDTILYDSFFEDIQDLTIMPLNNQVLHKREGYSQIFNAYTMIDLALQLDWKGEDEVYEGESKNVALLYEYWLFFELYSILSFIESSHKAECKDNSFISEQQGRVVLSLSQGKKSCQCFEIPKYGVKVNLYYNRSFTNKDFKVNSYQGSYSSDFRPDYTLAVFPLCYAGNFNGEVQACEFGDVSYIHFDAKYRINDLSQFCEDRGAFSGDEENSFSKNKSYKRDDLLKMHTYNDAIRRTIGSFVLYPGNSHGKDTKIFNLYDEILPGVGAIAVKPSTQKQSRSSLIECITEFIENFQLSCSRRNRLKYYSEIVLNEPASPNISFEEFQSIGNKQEKLGFDFVAFAFVSNIQNNRYYQFLSQNSLICKGKQIFYFYRAIKNGVVFTHHKDLSRAKKMFFYSIENEKFKILPIQSTILSIELLSCSSLNSKLDKIGYKMQDSEIDAEFYYLLVLEIIENSFNSNVNLNLQIDFIEQNSYLPSDSPRVLSDIK